MKRPRGHLPSDWPWLALSVALHVALLVFLLLNDDPVLTPAASEQEAEVIQARVLDATRLEQEREAARAAQRAREEAQRQQALEAARREAEAQAQREAEAQRRREQAQAQRQREAEAQRQREAEAQRRREAEAQARREAEERERREAQERARREAEAQARREAEAQARREAEAAERRERELAEALEREAEARAQARRTTELDRARDRYVAAIRDRIRGNWRLPPGEPEEFECRVRVTQAPGGQVLDVRILQSCGSGPLDRSVESAVLRSSPLPSPPDPEVFARSIEFVFRPH